MPMLVPGNVNERWSVNFVSYQLRRRAIEWAWVIHPRNGEQLFQGSQPGHAVAHEPEVGYSEVVLEPFMDAAHT